MGFLNYLKEVKQSFSEVKEKGWGFPVEIEGTFVKFMLDIIDGDHYVALDTDILVNNTINYFLTTNAFSTAHSLRIVISQHTIDILRHKVETGEEQAEIYAQALENIQRAINEGFKISIAAPVSVEEINQFGLEDSYNAAVTCSFLKAKQQIENIHKDHRTLYIASMPSPSNIVPFANHVNLPIYVIKGDNLN
jgi:hypothetical protein